MEGKACFTAIQWAHTAYYVPLTASACHDMTISPLFLDKWGKKKGRLHNDALPLLGARDTLAVNDYCVAGKHVSFAFTCFGLSTRCTSNRTLNFLLLCRQQQGWGASLVGRKHCFVALSYGSKRLSFSRFMTKSGSHIAVKYDASNHKLPDILQDMAKQHL